LLFGGAGDVVYNHGESMSHHDMYDFEFCGGEGWGRGGPVIWYFLMTRRPQQLSVGARPGTIFDGGTGPPPLNFFKTKR